MRPFTRFMILVVLIYWATFEGFFNKPNNKRAAQALVKTMERDSLNISGYYVNFDKRKGELFDGESALMGECAEGMFCSLEIYIE